MQRRGDEYMGGRRYRWPHVPHYHGDVTRQLFVVTATLMLVAAPFYADSLRTELPFEVAGALVLVVLAALTNPHTRAISIGNAVAAGVGLVIFQTWALFAYAESTWLQFVLRETIAIFFLVSFYSSVKTVRAFVMGKIGKYASVGEFDG